MGVLYIDGVKLQIPLNQCAVPLPRNSSAEMTSMQSCQLTKCRNCSDDNGSGLGDKDQCSKCKTFRVKDIRRSRALEDSSESRQTELPKYILLQ